MELPKDLRIELANLFVKLSKENVKLSLVKFLFVVLVWKVVA